MQLGLSLANGGLHLFVAIYSRLVDALDVDQNLRQDGHDLGQFGEWLAGSGNLGCQLHAGENAVASGCIAREDYVARLFAAKGVATVTNLLEHIAVADLGFNNLDAGRLHREL